MHHNVVTGSKTFLKEESGEERSTVNFALFDDTNNKSTATSP